MNVAVNGLNWTELQRYSIVTPLGIRFWDPATDTQVSDGLTVIAYPDGSRRQPTTAICTASGVYAFHGLPGLRSVEYPQGAPANVGSLPPVARFRVEVTDSNQRFIPMAFFIDVPFRGIYPTDLPTSLGTGSPPGFFLFSASTRPSTPLIPAVRAQLSERLDSVSERPAAFAVLEVLTPDNDQWLGIADENGTVASLFPYPTFTVSNAASSLMPSAAVPHQNWPLIISVRYQPSALTFVKGSPLPELRSILAQAPASIWTARANPPGQALGTLPATLMFGEELVLRSADEAVVLISVGSLP
jgi:hypothetical protein